jgi:hypothetical protein
MPDRIPDACCRCNCIYGQDLAFNSIDQIEMGWYALLCQTQTYSLGLQCCSHLIGLQNRNREKEDSQVGGASLTGAIKSQLALPISCFLLGPFVCLGYPGQSPEQQLSSHRSAERSGGADTPGNRSAPADDCRLGTTPRKTAISIRSNINGIWSRPLHYQ